MSKENNLGPVLITGANSGIGRKTLELLIDKEIEVYACARKDDDLEELNNLPYTTAIKLDVTKPEEIQKAFDQINQQGKGLYGLVNNAGIVNVGPIFTHSDEGMYEMFNINVFGVHRVTNAMLPFLFKSRGRIVNISSISGVLTGLFFGLYSMGKHALEAYSDALYQNLKEDGIEVSTIEPGNFKSEIGLNMFERIKKENKELRIFMNDKQRKMQLDEIEKHFTEPDTYPEPYAVAEAIYDALYSENPKPRYLVVSKQEEAERVMRKMFSELAQMNHNHEHGYSRDALVEMLDEMLKKQ